MSRNMRKPTFCVYEDKGTDQLCSNCTAYQCHCFCYVDSTIPVLFKSKISSLQPSSMHLQLSLCRTCTETTLFSHDLSHLS